MNPGPKLKLQCPIPNSEYSHVMIAHGGGGRLTRQLIDRMFLPLFENEFLSQGHDGALLPAIDGKLAIAKDADHAVTAHLGAGLGAGSGLDLLQHIVEQRVVPTLHMLHAVVQRDVQDLLASQ